MALTLDEMLARRPVDDVRVANHVARMKAEMRTYRLREIRKQSGLTQAELAARIGVGQRQISKIENGDLESARVETLRKYLEAVGGTLELNYVADDSRYQVA
ncbi:helix-turn-helix transcriptional regulator [Arthrobacter citreus]|uniref:helix-turn-helix transcriptional regulator n=1 Tax=Arthrobacter citreus TaxID=1670 RepID=UPI0036DB5AED